MLLWIQVGHDGQRMYRYLFCIFNKRSNQTVNHLNTVYFEQLVFFFSWKLFLLHLYSRHAVAFSLFRWFRWWRMWHTIVYPSYGRNCGFMCDFMGCLQAKHYLKIISELFLDIAYVQCIFLIDFLERVVYIIKGGE